METQDEVVERRLVQAIGRMDGVVTMGTKAVEYYRSRGLLRRVDGMAAPDEVTRQIEAILVAA